MDDWPLFELIFSNYKESISSELLEYLDEKLVFQLDSGRHSGGFCEGLRVEFGLHPMSSRSMLEGLPSMFEFREFYDEEYEGEPPRRPNHETEFRQLTQHPLATEKVVHEFLDQVHSSGCDGSVDACESCQSLLEEHWSQGMQLDRAGEGGC